MHSIRDTARAQFTHLVDTEAHARVHAGRAFIDHRLANLVDHKPIRRDLTGHQRFAQTAMRVDEHFIEIVVERIQ